MTLFSALTGADSDGVGAGLGEEVAAEAEHVRPPTQVEQLVLREFAQLRAGHVEVGTSADATNGTSDPHLQSWGSCGTKHARGVPDLCPDAAGFGGSHGYSTAGPRQIAYAGHAARVRSRARRSYAPCVGRCMSAIGGPYA